MVARGEGRDFALSWDVELAVETVCPFFLFGALLVHLRTVKRGSCAAESEGRADTDSAKLTALDGDSGNSVNSGNSDNSDNVAWRSECEAFVLSDAAFLALTKADHTLCRRLEALARAFDHCSFGAEVARRRAFLASYGEWLLMFLLLRLAKLDASLRATHYPFDLDTRGAHLFVDEHVFAA